MSEQWEVMWWTGSGASPDTPVRPPEGWEPFGFTEHGFWLRRRVPTQTYVSGAQQARLNEYPLPPWMQRPLSEAERRLHDEAQQAIALRANQPVRSATETLANDSARKITDLPEFEADPQSALGVRPSVFAPPHGKPSKDER